MASFYVAAFMAGVLMFLAPCTLPIVPGYLAFIGKGRVMRNAVAFVLGFSALFILFGMFAGGLGSLIGPYRELLGRAAGALIVLFGLTMLGLHVPLLSSERHTSLPSFLAVGTLQSSFLIGALFAIGWSPCIGPILGTILLIASTSSTAMLGALLLGAFSAGLAVPFLLTAFFIERVGTLFTRWTGATALLQKIGGLVLLAVGLLMLVGNGGLMTQWALDHIPLYESLLKYL